MGEIGIFSGSAHPELANEICSILNLPLNPTEISR
ncbi:MAG: ribose-phosphate pyrophosphokinase, partial [Thermomicrobiales bacterium]